LRILGENDPALTEELARKEVNRSVLGELVMWNTRLAPHPDRDRLGHAATRFWAAQTLVTTVMRESLLDVNAIYSPGIARAIETGAAGMFEVGWSQFGALTRTAQELVDWMRARRANSIAIIESPIGNSLPVQLICDLALPIGLPVSVVQWNAPRNDKPSHGRTVEEAAEDCAAAVRDQDYVVLLDEVLSGSRFLKLFDALVDRVGSRRFVSIGMAFTDTSRADLMANPNRPRLKRRLEEQGARVGYPRPWQDFPLQRLFKIDGGSHARWQSPVIWGDCELAAGKRKVNLIFTLLDHCIGLLTDLTRERSVFREYLERAWSKNTAGAVFESAPGVLRSTFAEIVTGLRIEDFRRLLSSMARERFPEDYLGKVATIGKSGVEERWLWLCETFIAAAKERVTEQQAWTAWNAFDATFAASFPDRPPAPRRDTDAAAYTLPFHETILAFNQKLRSELFRLAEHQQRRERQ